METIPQILTFIGLVLIIFLAITVIKLSATISDLRGKVLSLEETGRDASQNICEHYISEEELLSKVADYIEFEKIEKNKNIYNSEIRYN